METRTPYKVNGHTPKPIHPMYLTHRERQLIARLRQLRNEGERRAEVELDAEAGPRVIDIRPAM